MPEIDSRFEKQIPSEQPPAQLSPEQVGLLNDFLQGSADQGRALDGLSGVEGRMADVSESAGVDAAPGITAVRAATIGSLAKDPKKLIKIGQDIADKLQKEQGFSMQDIRVFMDMQERFSKAGGRVGAASDVIASGLSYVNAQERNGIKMDLFKILMMSGALGAVIDPTLRGSILRDLSGEKPG